MPRNASGVYSKPTGTAAVADQTISSADYNATIDDLVSDANSPRPISAGGHGGATVSEAQQNLELEPGVDVVAFSDRTPAGALMPYAGSTAPSGWLLCYGQAVNRTTYAALFAVLGTTYGAGDGSTTFNLPDLRGRSISGLDDMGGTAASRLTTAGSNVDGGTLGASGGEQSHTLTEGQLPTVNRTPSGDITLNLVGDFPAQTTGGGGPGNGFFSVSASEFIDIDFTGSSASFSGDQMSFGSDEAHNNMPPVMVMTYIIKT